MSFVLNEDGVPKVLVVLPQKVYSNRVKAPCLDIVIIVYLPDKYITG